MANTAYGGPSQNRTATFGVQSRRATVITKSPGAPSVNRTPIFSLENCHNSRYTNGAYLEPRYRLELYSQVYKTRASP